MANIVGQTENQALAWNGSPLPIQTREVHPGWYAEYQPKGMVMPGFPSNDFEQGPKNGKEVADFCYNTYDVKFSMFAKSSVKGTQANPLHALLVKLTGTEPKWNFYKYLIDRNNKVAGSYSSKVTMTDSQLVVDIEKSLAQ